MSYRLLLIDKANVCKEKSFAWVIISPNSIESLDSLPISFEGSSDDKRDSIERTPVIETSHGKRSCRNQQAILTRVKLGIQVLEQIVIEVATVINMDKWYSCFFQEIKVTTIKENRMVIQFSLNEG